MTTEEISRFVEFMTYTHCSVRLYDKLYWCLNRTIQGFIDMATAKVAWHANYSL